MTPCSRCSVAPTEEYYLSADDQVYCPACYQAEAPPPRRLGKFTAFLRAGLFGLIAAVVSAFANFLFTYFTNRELALVWIFLAIFIGVMVRWGGERRHSWPYKLLGACLTYLAVGMSLTMLGIAIMLNPQAFPAEPDSSAGLPSIAALNAPAASPTPQASGTPLPGSGVQTAPLPVSIAIGLIFCVIGVFVLPVYSCLQEPIGALIYGIALYQAWKTTGTIDPEWTGPHTVTPPADDSSESEE